MPEERISYPPTGSTTISLGLSRFSQIRTVRMVPSVLETSIRSVPTKVKRENDRDQIGIARAKAKYLHTTMHSSPLCISVLSWKTGKKWGFKCHFPFFQVTSVAVTDAESCMNINHLLPKPPSHEKTARKE